MATLELELETTLCGPKGMKHRFELAKAYVYLVATILAVVGLVHILSPGWSASAGFWCLLVTLLLIFLINAHGLFAQFAGLSFCLKSDPQLALVEIAAPLLRAFGSLLFLIGVILLLGVTWGGSHFSDVAHVTSCAYRMFIAGSALWLLRSIQDALQVYENTNGRAQFIQKTVSISLLLANTLILVSTILSYETWNLAPIAMNAKLTATWLAIVATRLLVLSAVMNVVRVLEMREFYPKGALLEPLMGGAQDEVEGKRDEDELFRDKYVADVEGGSYREAIIQAEEITDTLIFRHPLLSSAALVNGPHHSLIANYP